MKADEATILELTDTRRYSEALEFVQATDGSRRSRRAGLGLVWGISGGIWKKFGKRNDPMPDPDGIAYLEKLFQLGPDVHARDDMGRTALMYALHRSKAELAKKLIDLGSDLHAVDWESNDSVLDWAKLSGSAEIVELVERAIKEQSSQPRG